MSDEKPCMNTRQGQWGIRDNTRMNTASPDTRALRDALGQFATGVTIVTACDANGQPVGLTVNSFNAVSLHPPLIVWSLSRHVSSRPVFEQVSHYAVNVLAAEQEKLSRHFAGKIADRFAGVSWQAGQTGAPLLPDCAAHFEIRNTQHQSAGDHILFIGEVVRFEAFAREPLLFFASQYRQLQARA